MLGSQLYDALVRPSGARPGEGVVVIPHDTLHYLPFAALRDGPSWMASQRQISYAVSAAALVDTQPRTAAGRGVLALGNPDLEDPTRALPGAEVEVNQILTTFPRAQIYVQKEATRDRLVALAPRDEIVHVAAHALLDRTDPVFSALELAGPAPLRRKLEAHDIYELPLNSVDLVVLSACQTAMGTVANGDEFYGLTSAFLGAGVGAVIATLWSINDRSTAQLMGLFYAYLPSRGMAGALQQAQLGLISSKDYANPYYWAAFGLIGNARADTIPRLAGAQVLYFDTAREHRPKLRASFEASGTQAVRMAPATRE